ncbi:DNA topoisomerase, putative [Entamoeba histolytica HM-1:IMSS-B]|uniref:DNA topoisomerase (ATP-hydrolyzing) n=4 Tax=Entamoeba histolytica TaxID=5759 RepID=C4LZW3_ENTH1|nr:DNA topoisomerase, putative [Entamoeba histolytica HM-1:IMSS]EAL49301.1 DNA topoisomerase, putative [Entamoeba histolytica HM-1:IMSS]EMH74924.1 DNA topoisomerase, putative [Entamoeba histolytica HM-1:IMSS-B]EMS13999.1 DNA topoisomerase, putative [Entamoeba histolytica HM-3:IMSS]ENY64551.1 DNA topoisomerase, putative [Entamoeba histolytica HM-1:IMSS-A]|eukprot:XP_654689.1 DNA topoisomerase, putative [Entamoeba histolytica HM-1:IMSS]
MKPSKNKYTINSPKQTFINGNINQFVLDKIQTFLLEFISSLNCITTNKKFVGTSMFIRDHSLIKIAQVFMVLKVIQEATLLNISVTKRHIYYLDKNLFKHQRVVDEIVKKLSEKVFHLPKEDFHIVAAQKSFFCGNITMVRETKTTQITPEKETVIPLISTMKNTQIKTTATHILIVEKYTVFSQIIKTSWFSMNKNNILIITACGFPDSATKYFINLLISSNQQIKLCCMVDFDPFGLDIFNNYIRLDREYPILSPIRLLFFNYIQQSINNIPSSSKIPLSLIDQKKVCYVN